MMRWLEKAATPLAVLFVLVYLIFPVVVVVVISFSSVSYLSFPPPGFSLRWYEKVLENRDWLQSFLLTLQVSGLTALFSVLLGVPFAFALSRFELPFKSLLNAMVVATMITPPIVKGIGMYLYYAPFGLQNTVIGLAFAHTVSSVPFVVINTLGSLKSFDRNLERAAVIHGARPFEAIARITLPLIAPGVVIGAIFAFMHSAQELIVAMFLMGTTQRPLAVKLWEGVRVTFDPSIAAASTLVIVFAVLAFFTATLLQRRGRRLAPA